MNILHLRYLPVFVALLCTAQIFAQGGAKPQGLTAQEYVDQAGRLFLDGKFSEAAAMYQEFETSYGKSEEAKPLLRSTLYRLAMSFVQMKKFDEALEAISKALAAQPPLQKAEIQELTFWLGVANLEEENFAEAREAFEKFIALFPAGSERNPSYVQQFPAAVRISEARLLIGSAWLLEDKFSEAAEFYSRVKSDLGPENRGRATVLQLLSLIEKDDNEGAMKLISEEYPRMSDLAQLITFQTLTLELGNRWLDQGEYRKAIICLQRVWTSDRLLRHQESRLQDLETRLEAAEANPRGDPYTKMLLAQLIQKVKREIENFEKISSFDAALRLRLATAYQAMKRYREAALILQDMLEKMPPDKIVEQASVNLVQSWFEIERWPKVSPAAKAFVAKFPQSPSVPLVLYLSGLAEQKDNRYDEAVASFDTIIKSHPDSDFAARALFMKGFTFLLAERNKEAIAVFQEFPQKFPKHELSEASSYWRGMGYSLDKQFETSRSAMDEYLAQYKDGQYVANAVFRKAYCAQQMEDYKTSMNELRTFLRKFPGNEQTDEARVLLGDALMNEGEMEEGIAVFKGISPEQTRFYEEGVFKVGKALKLMDEPDRLLTHMQDFQKQNPRSPRVAEAIFQIGTVYRQRDQPDKAREIYWQAISEHGDDASIRSVEDLFPALQRLYKGDDAPQYLAALRDLQTEARAKGKKHLTIRALWAQGTALRKSDPQKSQELMLEAATMADVQTTSPLLLADFADALQSAGKSPESIAMYRDLVKWNPRAAQKDRALAALGFAEVANGNEKAALDWFDRFERESLGSAVVGKVLLAKADLLTKRGKPDEARAALESLLAHRLSSGKEKAEALYRIGESYMVAGKPELAIPYFQRIYVMHGRWGDWVAKAYFRSGQAFEKINDSSSARKSYQELTEKEDLAAFPETASAKSRLDALGGPIAEETPKG
ncbi:MAG: tetratricopeptide repeat protein [Terrimicrobiaceae bacterium]